MIYYFNSNMEYIGESKNVVEWSKEVEGYTPVAPTTEQKVIGCTYEGVKWVTKDTNTPFNEAIETLRKNTVNKVKERYDTKRYAPVNFNSVLFDGGSNSAMLINGAVELAKALVEDTVTVWDCDNIVHEMSLDEASELAAAIGKAYRDITVERQQVLTKVYNDATIEELVELYYLVQPSDA